MGSRYRTNRPTVISEIIDGEAVIIHLGTGCYYSLRGSASLVWDALNRGSSAEELVRLLKLAYDMSGTDAELPAVIDALLQELASEELVVPDEETTGSEATSLPLEAGRSAFETPRIERYTDLQDLILLDPVHDVDAQMGWPQAK